MFKERFGRSNNIENGDATKNNIEDAYNDIEKLVIDELEEEQKPKPGELVENDDGTYYVVEENAYDTTYHPKEVKESIQKKSFIAKIRDRMEKLKEVEHQDALARKMLTSPEFVRGETLLHRVQIEYLQELINVVEEPGLKGKLINRLF